MIRITNAGLCQKLPMRLLLTTLTRAIEETAGKVQG